MQDRGYFGPGSITWRVASEAILLVGGSRAVLMQIAHPLVAMGVSEHSSYMSDPFGRAERTFLMSQMLTFGSTRTAQRAARTINRLHTHVYGTLPATAGEYVAGYPYHARDPELLLWVHATLVDTVLLLYPLLVGPLSHEEQEHYYQESKVEAHLLGLSPQDMPETVEDLQRYIHTMVHSHRLAATPQARQIAQQVLFPRGSALLRIFSLLNLQITCALLPQPIREMYGLEWDTIRQVLFTLVARAVRVILSRLPTSLRLLPITRRIMEKGVLTWSNAR